MVNNKQTRDLIQRYVIIHVVTVFNDACFKRYVSGSDC